MRIHLRGSEHISNSFPCHRKQAANDGSPRGSEHISNNFPCHRKQATKRADHLRGSDHIYLNMQNPFLLRKHSAYQSGFCQTKIFSGQQWDYTKTIKDSIIEDNNIQYSYFTASRTILIIQAAHLQSGFWKFILDLSLKIFISFS